MEEKRKKEAWLTIEIDTTTSTLGLSYTHTQENSNCKVSGYIATLVSPYVEYPVVSVQEISSEDVSSHRKEVRIQRVHVRIDCKPRLRASGSILFWAGCGKFEAHQIPFSVRCIASLPRSVTSRSDGVLERAKYNEAVKCSRESLLVWTNLSSINQTWHCDV